MSEYLHWSSSLVKWQNVQVVILQMPETINILLLLRALRAFSGWGCVLPCSGPGSIRSLHEPVQPTKLAEKYLFFLLFFSALFFLPVKWIMLAFWNYVEGHECGVSPTCSKPFWHCFPHHKLCDFNLEGGRAFGCLGHGCSHFGHVSSNAKIQVSP